MSKKSDVNPSEPKLKDPAFPLDVPVMAKFKNWKYTKEGTIKRHQWSGDDDNYNYSFYWGPHNGPHYSQASRQVFGDGRPDSNVEVWLASGEKWNCFE